MSLEKVVEFLGDVTHKKFVDTDGSVSVDVPREYVSMIRTYLGICGYKDAKREPHMVRRQIGGIESFYLKVPYAFTGKKPRN
jgi:hypothetical protein